MKTNHGGNACLIIGMLFIICLFPALTAHADATGLLPSGYKLTIGLTVKETDFDYYRNSDTDPDPAGSMTEGMYPTWLLRLGSPYHFFSGSRWGYYIETGLSNFSMSKQNVGDEEKDLGTSVHGRFVYVAPVLVYLFGPPPKGRDEWSFITGVGVGAGYISARGDMILTEDGSNEHIDVNVDGVDFAGGLLLEAHYGNWVSRIYGGGPFIDVGANTFSVFEFSWDFGYVYTF